MENIVKEFLSAYYDMMSSNRANAVNMYKDHSSMTYQGDCSKGMKAIGEKIASFSFKTIEVGLRCPI